MKRFQPSGCNACGSEDGWVLHNVRHQGIYRRLCTSCVLKFHLGSFCPICFDVYEGCLSKENSVLCSKCPSISHLGCVRNDRDPTLGFLCPSCSNPNFQFFEIGGSKLRRKNGFSNGVDSVDAGIEGKINGKMGKVLFAASKIASTSMRRAALAARLEAQRRVEEALWAKKRAVEAMELLNSIQEKEKEKVKDKGKEKGVIGVLAQNMVVGDAAKGKEKGTVGVLTQNMVAGDGAKGKEKGTVGVLTQNMVAGDGADRENKMKAKIFVAAEEREKKLKAKIAAAAERKRLSGQLKVEVSGNSSAVLTSSNGGLKEKDKLIGFIDSNVAQKSRKNGVSIDGQDKLKESPLHVSVNEDRTQNVHREKEKNGLLSTIYAKLSPQGSHGMEADTTNLKKSPDSGH